ncbi:MAG: hypothetical protein U0228_28970 [Myxococcaceae bacterium]
MIIHNVLAAACEAIDVPLSEFEAEGKPTVNEWRYDDLVSWIAAQALPKLTPAQRAEIKRCEALVLKRRTKKLSRDELLHLQCDEDETDLPEGETIVRSLKMYAVKGARRSGAAAARLLGRPFLDALAKELWRLDARSLVDEYRLRPPKSPAIVASLWRGATGVRLTHQLVQLEGDRYGLIARTKGKWTWLEGSRDDMLASVPDGLMQSAIAAVMTGTPTTPRPPSTTGAAVILELGDDKFAAVAMAGDGTAWALTRRGRLGSMAKGAQDFTWSAVDAKGARGLVATKDGTAIVFGKSGVTAWRAGKATRLSKDDVVGAHVDGDGEPVWWSVDRVTVGGVSVKGFAKQSVSVVGKRVFVVGPKQSLVVDRASGKTVATLAIGGAGHAVSRDGSRLAVWAGGKASKEVRLVSTKDGAALGGAKLDSGDVDHAVFTDDGRLLVRYHGGLRVAFLDAAGKLGGRVEGRRLGTSGSTVRVTFPLLRGAVLGFANYPRGEAVLVDPQSQVLARWTLGTLYVGGQTRFAEGGGRLILTHDFATQRVLVV